MRCAGRGEGGLESTPAHTDGGSVLDNKGRLGLRGGRACSCATDEAVRTFGRVGWWDCEGIRIRSRVCGSAWLNGKGARPLLLRLYMGTNGIPILCLGLPRDAVRLCTSCPPCYASFKYRRAVGGESRRTKGKSAREWT